MVSMTLRPLFLNQEYYLESPLMYFQVDMGLRGQPTWGQDYNRCLSKLSLNEWYVSEL